MRWPGVNQHHELRPSDLWIAVSGEYARLRHDFPPGKTQATWHHKKRRLETYFGEYLFPSIALGIWMVSVSVIKNEPSRLRALLTLGGRQERANFSFQLLDVKWLEKDGNVLVLCIVQEAMKDKGSSTDEDGKESKPQGVFELPNQLPRLLFLGDIHLYIEVYIEDD